MLFSFRSACDLTFASRKPLLVGEWLFTSVVKVKYFHFINWILPLHFEGRRLKDYLERKLPDVEINE